MGVDQKVINIQNESAREVMRTVEDIHNIKPYSILSPDKTWKVCDARHLCAYILHKVLGYRLVDTASIMMRDHSTIFKSCEKHQDLYGIDSAYRDKADIVMEVLQITDI